jgi:RNase P subunit RPR2
VGRGGDDVSATVKTADVSPPLYFAACDECGWEADYSYMEREEAEREAWAHRCEEPKP